ncbi:MAG: hypothetical protein WAN10_00175 [Candidatus Acidiferrales bacterium]
MKSFRETLEMSHVAAVAVAVLLFSFLNSLIRALSLPLSDAADFLVTAMAIGGWPYHAPEPPFSDRITLIATLFGLFAACISLAAAWLLSRWVYGVGPVASLKGYGVEFVRRNRV